MAGFNNPSGYKTVIAAWLLLSALLAILLFSAASPHDRVVAIRTICLGLSASLIALPLGSLIAWACRGRGFLPRLLLICTIAMLLVPMFIHVSGWDAAFGKLGWLTSTKGQVLVPLVSGWTAAIWIHGVAAAPQVALILLIGLSAGRRVYEEQALLDTSEAGVFWNVTMKRLWPLLILSTAWIVVSAAREIAVTDLYQIGTLAEQIYLGYSLGINSIGGNWTAKQLAEAGSTGELLSLSMVVWFSLTAFMFFFFFTDLEYESDAFLPLRSAVPTFKRSFVAGLLLGITVAIPIGNVIARACFFVRPVDGVPTQGYSIDQLFHSLRRSCVDYQSEFVWSFLIASTSSTLIMILATLLAFWARRSRIAQIIYAATLAICSGIPGPYIGTLIASLFSSVESETVRWFYNYTIAAPVLANFIFCWPIGALVVWYVFRKIPEDVLESSLVEGASRFTRFVQFGIVANAPALIGCWLISLAFSFGELSASQMVRPAGIDTVPRKMLGDLHAGVNELTAGITIVTAFTIVVISLAGWWFIRLNRWAIDRQ